MSTDPEKHIEIEHSRSPQGLLHSPQETEIFAHFSEFGKSS